MFLVLFSYPGSLLQCGFLPPAHCRIADHHDLTFALVVQSPLLPLCRRLLSPPLRCKDTVRAEKNGMCPRYFRLNLCGICRWLWLPRQGDHTDVRAMCENCVCLAVGDGANPC
ncbi:uncharacterized protein BJ171DRAFT_168982 [Polychytrium aggregatum]|uniref:uncharacterized protein n=1 Tax=Polychytrium aggregatum TaxID=110093 RepID=UPI0022FDFE2E|nr:uncharacterized protein BJ171DRAFT_168982 [Polychytrium aggregatum]KAI9208819.1 hypothetical protein BJ171DRAFT_168982 [Polychytrium aggregatum]